jgi:hypothetical protein
MRWTISILLLLGGAIGAGADDPTDLYDGVFLVHALPATLFSSEAPEGGWCGLLAGEAALETCRDQVTRIDSDEGSVWFVLAAWGEPKEWASVGFGLGDYDPNLFAFADHGACFPDQGLQLPTPDWPGPNQGVALTVAPDTWKGNFVPIYFFVGYAYAPGRIPLSVEPRTQTAGLVQGAEKSETIDAVALGALGLFSDGIAVCPPDFEEPPAADREP